MEKNINQIKICVSIIEKDEQQILNKIKMAKESNADIIEWRSDYYEDVAVIDHVVSLLKKIRKILDGKELIFTYRSVSEGGVGSLSMPEYMLLVKTVILTKLIDYVDVELLIGDTAINNIIKHAKINETKLMFSNHDFNSTPRSEIIVNRLKLMESKGADYCKIACMPRCEEDVEELIKAGIEMKKRNNNNLILISMGELGKRTRLNPQEVGSCMTFASLDGKVSAPGQIAVEEVYKSLNK